MKLKNIKAQTKKQFFYFFNLKDGLLEDATTEIRDKMLLVIPFLTILFAAAMWLNLSGYKRANFVIAIVINALYWIGSTKTWLKLGAVGLFISNVSRFTKSAFSLTGETLTWVSFMLLFVGFFPLRYNYYSVPTLVIGLLLIGYFNLYWEMKIKWAKPLSKLLTYIIVIFCFASLVSKAFYEKTLGFNPIELVEINELELRIKAFQTIDKANAQKKELKVIDLIEEQLKTGKTLDEIVVITKDGQIKANEVIGKLDKKINNDSIPKKISGLFRKNPLPQEKIVTFKPNEPANTGLVAQMGDTVKYINPTAPFRVPGREKFHLVSTTTEHEATGFGSIVIYGFEKEGYVQVMVIPQEKHK